MLFCSMIDPTLAWNLFSALILALVEGITEWLPVSSTGHLILAERVVPLAVTPAFRSLFLVVIQLGAIFAVIWIYGSTLWPFQRTTQKGLSVRWKPGSLSLWSKIIVASLPAGLIGVALDDVFDRLFYRPFVVALMLVLIGLWFLWVERPQAKRPIRFDQVERLTYPVVFWIGCFQLLAAALPGTSRSGATILGALLLGVSRKTATDFTFYLAVPAMLGASLLKLLKFPYALSGSEGLILGVGLVFAFLISLPVIRLLLRYIRRHDFRAFGYYRIVLGLCLFACMALGFLEA